jgi:hypothetical protein
MQQEVRALVLCPGCELKQPTTPVLFLQITIFQYTKALLDAYFLLVITQY